MINFIKRSLKAAQQYTILDFACLKILLLSFGLLLGAYFPQFFLDHTFFLWVVFILTLLWIIYRTFIKHPK